jgi:hypothetical protein
MSDGEELSEEEEIHRIHFAVLHVEIEGENETPLTITSYLDMVPTSRYSLRRERGRQREREEEREREGEVTN